MGGKSKQSQRIKNNARPSSSSRSAELLSSSAGLDGGLLTLGNGKPLPPLFPTLAATNLEQGLNPEFQVCIKKLNKKDPITRTKALQELCELINKGDVEDVVSALPSWAHFYKILTTDTDRKVREMTQVCQGAVVRACGRRLAPQLKALLPAWLQAQYDDHAPAQAQAHLSLTSTFPDNKLPEVIAFCKAEVIAHLLDNLNGNTEAIIKKRIDNVEERELQMSRIVTSSLQGLQYFARHLPAEHDAWLWAALEPLLQANAFWKLPHSGPQVRAAWLGALGGLAARFGPALGAAHGARALRLLLGPLLGPAAPPTPAAPAWGCLLLLMQHVPDWHSYLDKKELLVKRILDLLENGGWGDAKQLSNILLPLLAYLPQDILTKDFYETFFNAMLTGLETKNVLNSKSERQAWIRSLAECLRYVSIQEQAGAAELASAALRAWLRAALAPRAGGPLRAQLARASAAHMADLLEYWLKQSEHDKTDKYDHLVRNFWQNVNSTILAQIDNSDTDHDEIEQLIDAHIVFLQTLKTTFSQEAKKQHSIKFDDDERAPLDNSAAGRRAACPAALAARFAHGLAQCAHACAARHLQRAQRRGEAPAAPLAALLRAWDGAELAAALAAAWAAPGPAALYQRELRAWLAAAPAGGALLDLVFLLLQYMTEPEQDAVFDSFEQLGAELAERCLGVCVSHPHVSRGAARRWLRGGGVARRAGALAGRAARGDSPAAALLLACLADAPDGGWLVSAEGVAGAVQAACAALEGAGEGEEGAGEGAEGELAAAAALGARLAVALAGSRAPHYPHLLLQLLCLDVRVPRGDSRLPADAWCEVRSSWQDGAAALPPADRAPLLQRVAAFLRRRLLAMDKLDIAKIEDIVSPCPHLFKRCDDTGAPDDVTEIVDFTKLIFDMKDPETQVVESYALRYECVTSQLNCLYDDDNDVIAAVVRDSAKCDVPELTEADLLPYVNKLLFRAIYLRSLLLHRPSGDEHEHGEHEHEHGEHENDSTWCDALLHNEYLLEEFCKVIYNFIVIDSLHEGYAFWRQYPVLAQARAALAALLARAVAGPAGAGRERVRRALGERGYLWPRAARWLHLHAPPAPEAPHVDPLEGHKLEDIVSGNGFFHTLQARVKWSSDSEAEYNMKYLVMLRSWYIAHGAGDAELLRDVTGARLAADLDVVVNAYYRRNHTMLYDRDISECGWSEVVSNVAVVEFLCSMVTSRGWDAPAHHWDFVTITLCSLLNSLRKSMDSWASTKVAMLARSVLRLWARVRQCVRGVRAECERRQPAAHVAALPREWDDIFAPDSHAALLALALHVLESCPESEMTSARVEVIGALIECIELSDWFALPAALRAGELSLPRLALAAAAALQHAPHHACSYLAYHLLLALAEPLVLDDAEKLALWSENCSETDETKERPQFYVELLDDAFTHLHDIVEDALGHVVLGAGTCAVAAGGRAWRAALAWLLLGAALGALAERARGDLAQQYGAAWRARRLAERVLAAALRLLPPRVWAACADAAPHAPQAPPPDAQLFLDDVQLSVHEPAAEQLVGALACRGVWRAVSGAGAAGARGWWGAAAARPARLLARLVRRYVAPPAVRAALRDLQRRAAEIDDAEVRVASSTGEVVCVYTVDERRIELRVWLSPEHPLVPPRLAAPHAQGPGANTHWLALYLAYQNGTLLNALKMWTSAVSARVESSPQCYVCYCRLHPTSGRLPRVLCHQCRNKFHNVCLRKWFNTSNKSTCPLCRSPF